MKFIRAYIYKISESGRSTRVSIRVLCLSPAGEQSFLARIML